VAQAELAAEKDANSRVPRGTFKTPLPVRKYSKMTDDIQGLLRRVDSGTPEESWEAAKQLSAMATEIAFSLIGLLQRAA
jgi:hypothetical protein